MEHNLDAAIFDALRQIAVNAAELRAAKARFDALIRLRDAVGDFQTDERAHHATA